MRRIAHRAARSAAVLEGAAVRLAERHGLLLLRLSLGIVFVWFAAPKFKPGLSAVDTLAQDTIGILTLQVITGSTATYLLALLELGIGIGLLTGRFLRLTLAALMLQMAGTLTPLVLFPQLTWKAPGVLTLEGQFIVKNIVLVAAGFAVAASLGRVRATSRPFTGRRVRRSPDEQPRTVNRHTHSWSSHV
ncbi:DoxX family membrane protein [Actinoplanes sp. NPDC023714]|uniref:DoxX family membrane protein n=1 Tax=Actinoplanes sp. NPDC023714 TaxID=3154322 RepID=UPI0034083C8A